MTGHCKVLSILPSSGINVENVHMGDIFQKNIAITIWLFITPVGS